MGKTNFRKLATAAFLWLSCMSFAQAQGEAPSLATPRDAVYTHLYYLGADSYQPELSALAVPDPKKGDRRKIAIRIKQVLDGRNLYVVMSKLPEDADYKDSTGLSLYYLFPDELPEINLKRGEDGQWRYSEETLELLPQLHADTYPYGSDILLNFLPKMGTGKFLGIMVWQYLGFGIFLSLAFLLHKLLVNLLDKLLVGLAKRRLGYEMHDRKSIHNIGKYLGVVLIIYLLQLFLPVLQLPIELSMGLDLVLDIFRTCFFVFLALRILDFVMIYVRKWAAKTETRMDDQLLGILFKGIQILVGVFGIIAVLSRLDVNVTALLAGVSVGGLAIALAAQDSVKNLIGAVMIFIDKPFDVGDYIIAGSVQGVVETVGFRSTRIRAADTSIISVPNGRMADETINNLGRRVYRRYRTELGIRYDTPPETISRFVDALEQMLSERPDTLDDKTEVHLRSFGPSALNIFLQTFFTVDSWSAELRGGQVVMLRILELAEALGVEFAFPSQSMYVETGVREVRPKGGEEQVAELLAGYRKEDGNGEV